MMISQNSTIEPDVAEVSGWDSESEFFVENASIAAGESQAKTLRLRHHLHSGSMVFVRLYRWSGLASDFPVAHQVVAVGPSNASGFAKVRLLQTHPRYAVLEASQELFEHLTKR